MLIMYIAKAFVAVAVPEQAGKEATNSVFTHTQPKPLTQHTRQEPPKCQTFSLVIWVVIYLLE
jgi:hypothetical protein